MTAPRPGRSRGFWLWGWLLLFALHALGIFFYGERKQVETPWQRPEPFLHIGGSAAIDEQMAQWNGWRDPTLFALPHPEGFSGGAWLQFQPEMPRQISWSAAPEWLPLSAGQWGESLREYVATNGVSEESWLAALRAPKTLEVRLPGEILLTKTSARIEGPLAARPLVRAPELTGVTHPDVLKSTTVSLAVNGEGVVESLSVSSASGSPVADERALELARRFEFQPLAVRDIRVRETTPPTLGRLIFTWQVLPTTNALTAATP